MPMPPFLGGAVEKVHLLLAGAYRVQGHEVVIVSRRYKSLSHAETIDGISHVRVPSINRSPSLLLNLVFDFYYALQASFRCPQADITITNSFFLPILLRRRIAGKIYVHVARYPKHQMRLYFRADRLQAISTAVADAIVSQEPKLANKIVTIGYPVPDRYFQETALPRQKTILYVGRIAREKGIHLLVKAFAALRKGPAQSGISAWKLRILGPHDIAQGGDGDAYLAELKELARPMGLACEFVGPIFDEQKLIEEYRRAAIFVYPSLAEKGEAFGLAPLEAMAAGCAVVVSNLRCFDDFVEDGKSGLVFDHRGTQAEENLSARLGQLASDQGLVERIAGAGRASANNFRTSEIARQMLADFRTLLKNAPSRS